MDARLRLVTRDVDAPREAVWDVRSDGWCYAAWVVGASRVRSVWDVRLRQMLIAARNTEALRQIALITQGRYRGPGAQTRGTGRADLIHHHL